MKIYSQNKIEELAQILKNDGVISVPTDTVYGLCARISSKKALNALMMAKNRPTSKLFPIMCANEEQIKEIAIINKRIEKIIRNFMPGPITLVLNKNPKLPAYINNGEKTVAVRMATSKTLEDLIYKTGCPLFMSSANQSGMPTCTTLEEIEKCCPTIDAIMEGSVYFGQGSTIVDCTSDELKILREGPISIEKLKESYGENK